MKQKNRMRLKEILSYEKSHMLPLNFFAAYILTPAYIVISALILTASVIFMEIDEEKYLATGLVCLGLFIILSIAVLMLVPYIRKEAIKSEMKRYDFNVDNIEVSDVYFFSDGDFILKFDKNGMYVDDKLYFYDYLKSSVVTNNHCQRINIGIEFSISEEVCIVLSLSPTVLKMLEIFRICLENQETLGYIITNKETAFKKIYNKGFITGI